MIASIAERAREQGVPVDGRHRRPRRLPAHRPRVARARDGDRARDHRDQALRPRGGHRALRDPARADPRLLRAQGRHLGQHPRRPGHRRQDRLAAAAALRRRSRSVLAHVDEISGAKRKENLRDHADDARDLQAAGDDPARRPGRRRPRSTRPAASPTARGCARSSASSSCATRCAAWRRRSGTPRRPRPPPWPRRRSPRASARATLQDAAALAPADGRLALAVRAPEAPEGELLRPRGRAGASAWPPARRSLAGDADAPEERRRGAGRPAR